MTETIDALKRDAVFTTISVPREVKTERVMGLLCGLIENGYSSWSHRIKSYDYATGLSEDDFKEGGRLAPKEDYWPRYCRVPLHDNCSMILLVDDEKEGEDSGKTREAIFNPENIKKGLELMAKNSPKHFNDLLDENDDANTADIFGQYVVYGEVVYG